MRNRFARQQAVVITHKDNVATAIMSFKKGMEIHMLLDDELFKITANEDIPYGHKIAMKNIKRGENVIKYGESIGRATKDIASGDHVHVHNLVSRRLQGSN